MLAEVMPVHPPRADRAKDRAGAKVRVTLEIEVEAPNGVPDNVVRIVTENGRALKFSSQGFEEE